MLLFQHSKNIALILQVDCFYCMLFCYGITYIKVSQQYSPAVWKFRYNGKTQNSKVNGAFSSINMLNVTLTFLICSLFSWCTTLPIQIRFFFIYLIFFYFFLISVLTAEIIFRYLLLRLSLFVLADFPFVGLPFLGLFIYLHFSFIIYFSSPCVSVAVFCHFFSSQQGLCWNAPQQGPHEAVGDMQLSWFEISKILCFNFSVKLKLQHRVL